MSFYSGQKVVCVDDSMNPETVEYTPMRPRKGNIYIIRGFLKQNHIDGYGIYLEELLNPSIIWSDQDEKEWPFKPERFRPLDERKTNISIFEEMFSTSPAQLEPV